MPVEYQVSQSRLEVFNFIRNRWAADFLKDFRHTQTENQVEDDPTLANNIFFESQAYLFKETLSSFQLDEDYAMFLGLVCSKAKQHLLETTKLDVEEINQLVDSAYIYFWAGVLTGPGGNHELHRHYDSFLSGVYYLTVPPASGWIRFEDHEGELHIEPEEDLLLLFHSSILHEVLPCENRLTSPRVAVAFNFIDRKSTISTPTYNKWRWNIEHFLLKGKTRLLRLLRIR